MVKSYARHRQPPTRKFKFTYADIADVTGLKADTLRGYVYQGRFNPRDLKSLVTFIFPRLKPTL